MCGGPASLNLNVRIERKKKGRRLFGRGTIPTAPLYTTSTRWGEGPSPGGSGRGGSHRKRLCPHWVPERFRNHRSGTVRTKSPKVMVAKKLAARAKASVRNARAKPPVCAPYCRAGAAEGDLLSMPACDELRAMASRDDPGNGARSTGVASRLKRVERISDPPQRFRRIAPLANLPRMKIRERPTFNRSAVARRNAFGLLLGGYQSPDRRAMGNLPRPAPWPPSIDTAHPLGQLAGRLGAVRFTPGATACKPEPWR
jgi:hypothetical protein